MFQLLGLKNTIIASIIGVGLLFGGAYTVRLSKALYYSHLKRKADNKRKQTLKKIKENKHDKEKQRKLMDCVITTKSC